MQSPFKLVFVWSQTYDVGKITLSIGFSNNNMVAEEIPVESRIGVEQNFP